MTRSDFVPRRKKNKNKFKNKKLEKCANLLDNKTEVSELKVSQIKNCGFTILPIMEEIVKNIFFVFPPISLVSRPVVHGCAGSTIT